MPPPPDRDDHTTAHFVQATSSGHARIDVTDVAAVLELLETAAD